MRLGLSIEEIFNFTKIDPWFLYQIEDLIKNETKLKTYKLDAIDKPYLFELKQKGFSDHRIGYLLGEEEKSIRELRAKNIFIQFIKEWILVQLNFIQIPRTYTPRMNKNVNHAQHQIKK